jgi:hypothetical protein
MNSRRRTLADVEGSIQLWETQPDDLAEAVTSATGLLREVHVGGYLR